MFSVQSFGDIITNSSTEVFVIHHPDGLLAIREAVNNIFKILAPDKNPEDYVEISLEFDGKEYEESFNEYINDEILPKYDYISNEEFLANFSEEYQKEKLKYIQRKIASEEGYPIAIYSVKGLNPEGEVLAEAINNIIESTYCQERFC